jgi:hypothetical protein
MNDAFFENEFDFGKDLDGNRRIWKVNKTAGGHLCNNISVSYTVNRQDWMPQNKNNIW